MNFKKLLPVFLLVATISFTSCGPKDSELQTKSQESLNANPETSGTTVSVKDGVATLSGEVESENAKVEGEQAVKGVKGVKSVVNNLTVAPAPVISEPVVVSTDSKLTSDVNDAIKDNPGVSATVVDGVVTLSGTISKDNNRKLMMQLNTLGPKKIENNLIIK